MHLSLIISFKLYFKSHLRNVFCSEGYGQLNQDENKWGEIRLVYKLVGSTSLLLLLNMTLVMPMSLIAFLCDVRLKI
jgi:hypothetical protein